MLAPFSVCKKKHVINLHVVTKAESLIVADRAFEDLTFRSWDEMDMAGTN